MPTRILSFDVGIRNLAVCLLERTGAEAYKVLQWELIDLVGAPMCSSDGCKQKSACMVGGVHHCAKHSKKNKISFRPPSLTEAKLNAMTKDALLAAMKTQGMTIMEPKDKKSVLVETFHNYLLTRYVAEPVGKTKYTAVSIPLADVGHALRAQCAARPWMLDGVSAVCIEKQMKSRMIAVQMMLWMFFMERGVPAHIVSASHKLTVSGTDDVKKRTYKQRKQSSVAVCLSRLDARWRKFFSDHNKKDDLGDCLLQGEWFLLSSGQCQP